MEKSQLGTAYGLNTAILNASLFLTPSIVGFIPAFQYKILYLFVLISVALVITIAMWLLDRCLQHGKIEMTCVKVAKSQKSMLQWIREHIHKPKTAAKPADEQTSQ